MEMSYEFEKCLEKRKLVRFECGENVIKKETGNAVSDMERAKNDLSEGDHKWAIVKGYYSMFHAAKALVYSFGYREKSHYCLLVALRELCIKQLGIKNIKNFEDAMKLRQEADYEMEFTQKAQRTRWRKHPCFLRTQGGYSNYSCPLKSILKYVGYSSSGW